MSQLAIPQVRCEIFRNPAFWDDNFVSWASLPDHSIISTDGDVATVEVAEGETTAGIAIHEIDAFYVKTQKYAVIKIDEKPDGNPVQLYIRRSSTGYYTWAGNISSTGIHTIDMSGEEEDKHYGIQLKIANCDPGDKFKVDFVAICEKTMLVPSDTWDLLTELQITLPLLSSGIAGVNPLKFPNFNAEYTGLISPFDIILLYLWRKGDSMKKVFGGRIAQPGTTGSGSSQEYYVNHEAVGHGQALHSPESLLQKRYEGINGRTIISDALACCSRVTDKFVDVDQEIESSHNIDFDEGLPFDVINEICRQAKTLGAVVGFDGYVDPAANTHIFRRGKYVSIVSLLESQIDPYSKSVDILRIKNKIPIYGKEEKSLPLDKDKDTESDGSRWSSGATISWSTTDPQVGSKCLQFSANSVSSIDVFHLTAGLNETIDCDAWKRDAYKLLSLFINLVASPNPDGETSIDIQLYAPDINNRFTYSLSSPANPRISAENRWFEFNIPLGPSADGWGVLIGNPDWSKIERVRFYIYGINTGTITIRFDGYYYGKRRFSAIVENKISQAKYRGVYCREPEVDDSLLSDTECEARALSICDFLSEPITKFTLQVEGDNRYRPGDKLHIQLTNDQIDDWFRIVEVKQIIRGVDWDTYLTLSNEPEMIDYVFAMVGAPRKAGASVVIGISDQKDVDFLNINEAIEVLAS